MVLSKKDVIKTVLLSETVADLLITIVVVLLIVNLRLIVAKVQRMVSTIQTLPVKVMALIDLNVSVVAAAVKGEVAAMSAMSTANAHHLRHADSQVHLEMHKARPSF
jgi:hypothetical protein